MIVFTVCHGFAYFDVGLGELEYRVELDLVVMMQANRL